jgi:subtilisin family serine protease
MKKRRYVFVIILILVVFLSYFTIASISEQKTKQRIPKNLYEISDSGQEIRVIITLKDNQQEKRIRTASYKNNEKPQIISKLGKNKVKHKFNDGTISAIVNSSDLEKLEEYNQIESVKKEEIMNVFLKNSTEIINASKTWSLKHRMNLTGKGQSICVIDTGINYSHPDLGGCYGNNNASSKCKVLGGMDYCSDDANCVSEDSDPLDVNGHGTHVAGIAAANGSLGLKGIAPDAKIIAIKAGNSSGSFWTSDVKAGIEWCINNATKFNISVISLSLGSGQYDGYCDSGNLLATPINNATLNNISVVIATGNTNAAYPNPVLGIANPSCIENATRITATDKNDDYGSYAFRNSNFTDILAAPGSDINSTYLTSKSSSGYYQNDGTSMAAPHVAGAIAIIKQFLSLSEQSKNPKEIGNILNNTGKVIYDSNTNTNYTRIDIYSAILSLDNISPNVSLISPSDNKVNLTINQTFRCNISEWQLSNVTFYLWNSTSLYYNETKSLSNKQVEFNISDIDYGNYEWNCLAQDALANSAFAISNFSLTIGGFSTSLSPLNNSYKSEEIVNLTCSIISDSRYSIENTTLYIWNSTKNFIYNKTKSITGKQNSSSFLFNFSAQNTPKEQRYYWNCLSYNNVSNYSWAENNFTLNYDKTKPNISLISPSDGSSWKTNSKEINFQYNVSDNFEIENCSLIINNKINITNSTIFNLSKTHSFVQIFSPSSYTWKINCSDKANNFRNSSERTFTISTPKQQTQTTSSSGGGGISSVSKTYNPGKEELYKGYTKDLSKKDKIKFYDKNYKEHLLTIENIKENYVNITIQSTVIQLFLGIGQSAKINLTSSNYYDLFVKLNKIENNKADLTIQTINEPITPEINEKKSQEQNKTKKENPEKHEGGAEKEQEKKYLIYIVLACLSGIIIVGFVIHAIENELYKDRIKRLRKKIKNKL